MNIKNGLISITFIGVSFTSWGDSLPQYSMQILPSLGGSDSKVMAINDVGTAVGMSTRNDEDECIDTSVYLPCKYAALWQDGVAHDLGQVSNTSDSTLLNDINNQGKVIGQEIDYIIGESYISKPIAGDAQGINHLTLLIEDGDGTANDINESNTMVGWARNEAGKQQLVSWQNGVITPLQESEDYNRWGLGINNTGWIVGLQYMPWSGRANNGFVLKGNTLSTIGESIDIWSEGHAINDYGVIVGSLASAAFSQPFSAMWIPTIFGGMETIKLGTLDGHITSVLSDVNNLGQAVGQSSDDNGDLRAVITHGFNLYDLNELTKIEDGVLTEANGINASGQIAATLSTSNGLKAVILTPQ